MTISKERLKSEAYELANHIEKRGYVTHDPNDLHDKYLWLGLTGKNPIARVSNKAINQFSKYFPILARKILNVKKTITPGGMAALAKAYIWLNEIDPKKGYIDKAKIILQWLSENSVKKESGQGWGFPFHWNSFALIPPNTPIGHTTMNCANAFRLFWEKTNDDWARIQMTMACNFLKNLLPHTTKNQSSIALAYTPLDRSQVINTNADIGSLLIIAGSKLGNDSYVSFGRKIITFVLEAQNKDGSWYYNAPDYYGGPSKIDNYHTGMVLAALSECMPFLDNPLNSQIKNSVEIGTKYYINYLFTEKGEPKHTSVKQYPYDIYSYYQAIITNIKLKKLINSDSSLNKIQTLNTDLVHNLLSEMKNPKGGFHYQNHGWRKTTLDSLRWVNAPILEAIVFYIADSMNDN